jgi:hypothetical protein
MSSPRGLTREELLEPHATVLIPWNIWNDIGRLDRDRVRTCATGSRDLGSGLEIRTSAIHVAEIERWVERAHNNQRIAAA